MNRRTFLQTTALGAAGTALLSHSVCAQQKAGGVNWPIGCFNRPWVGGDKNWGYDAALDGIKAAGYRLTGLLTRTPNEAFIGADATPEYLAELKKRIAARGLKVNMAALRTRENLDLAGQIKDIRKQIDNGKVMGVEYLLTFGANKPENYEDYYRLMQDAAPYAQERGLKVVLKPHGGASGAAEEIMRCIEKVKHPNFKIWFDAGNVLFYTGKDPLEELKPIVQHVTGFCAKDCDGQKGSVWLNFGMGKVDFKGVFSEMKKAGFNGPIMVECCAQADTADKVTGNARKNREYLEELFRAL
jgi:sugar phosphate isomerase/epimerase